MSLKISKQTKRGRDDTAVFVGNGNVFQDLGRPDAAEALAKVELAYRIHRLIEDSGLTQTQAARRLAWISPKSQTSCAVGSRIFRSSDCSAS